MTGGEEDGTAMGQLWEEIQDVQRKTPLLFQASGFPRRTSHASVNRRQKGTCLQRTGWGETKRFFNRRKGFGQSGKEEKTSQD